MNELPILDIAKRLRAESRRRDHPLTWMVPRETTIGGGWYIDEDHPTEYRRVIVSYGPEAEWLIENMQALIDAERAGVEIAPPPERMWVHASISRRWEMPTYADLTMLHFAVWAGAGWSYQVFAPSSDHVNIHEYALHLWGRLDGRAELPNFGALGTI